MAIKKCDDITEEGVVEAAEETTTGSEFETQPSTQSSVESQNLAESKMNLQKVHQNTNETFHKFNLEFHFCFACCKFEYASHI